MIVDTLDERLWFRVGVGQAVAGNEFLPGVT
jgi:hypothetical protein